MLQAKAALLPVDRRLEGLEAAQYALDGRGADGMQEQVLARAQAFGEHLHDLGPGEVLTACLPRRIRIATPERRAALDPGTVEDPLRAFHRHQRARGRTDIDVLVHQAAGRPRRREANDADTDRQCGRIEHLYIAPYWRP